MRKTLPILIVMVIVFHSCGQEHDSSTVKLSKKLKKSQPLIDTVNQTRVGVSDQKNVDAKFVYVDDNEQKLIIEKKLSTRWIKIY